MNLQKKLANLLASTKRKRPYYCEVEYIESTNQQSDSSSTNAAAYIDTGIIPNDNTKIECRMQFTTLISGQSKEALNGTTGSESAPRFAWGFASLSPYTNFYFGLGAQNLTTSVTRDTNVHTFVLDAKNKTCSIDDTTESFTSSGSVDSTRSIYLFARHATGSYANKPCNVKIYRYRNWNNDQLVQDLIPVLDWDYVPCMYDKVSGELFYNQGTGNFVAGREIHRTEYLESTGTQWIDTGVNPENANTQQLNIETDFAVLTPGSDQYIGIFGAAVPRFGFYTRYNNMCFGYSAAFDNLNEIEYGKKYNLKFNVTKGSQNATLDGVNVWSATRNEALQNTYTIGLFCRNYSTPQWRNNARIYNLKIVIGGILVRDYIPAIDENGVGFMFDRVTHTIYDNAGTDAFKYPAREVEYLESDGESFLDTQYVVQPEDILTFGSNSTNGNGSIEGAISSTTERLHGFNATAHVYVGSSNYTVGSGLWNANSIWKVDLKNGILHYGSHFVKMTGNYTSLPNVSFCFMARHNNMSGDTYDNLKAGSRFTFFKVTRNGSLIRDFIPCYKDGVACMVDKLTGTAYLNQGTGTFVTGKIKEAV